MGDTVYIEDAAYQITELRDDTVQLLPAGMVYPIYRAERKEQFEQLLRADRRNAYYTEFLPIDPDKADQDLRDVLVHGLMDESDKQQISTLLQSTGQSAKNSSSSCFGQTAAMLTIPSFFPLTRTRQIRICGMYWSMD